MKQCDRCKKLYRNLTIKPVHHITRLTDIINDYIEFKDVITYEFVCDKCLVVEEL